jgi:hypothetical protein
MADGTCSIAHKAHGAVVGKQSKEGASVLRHGREVAARGLAGTSVAVCGASIIIDIARGDLRKRMHMADLVRHTVSAPTIVEKLHLLGRSLAAGACGKRQRKAKRS